jgi:biotin-dependent carboxylase-like uncharacterized protein
MKEIFRVLSPGSYTTVQDRGRTGYQHLGIPLSGVLDRFAFRVANLLAGNAEDCAVLEMTVIGPRLEALGEADVGLSGADLGATLNGKPVPLWTSFRVAAGDMLAIQQFKSGCRAYLAVTGGIQVPRVMGSRSTYVGGKLGGFGGRPLRESDILSRGEGDLLKTPRQMPGQWIPEHTDPIVLRAVAGPQDDFFDQGLDIFFSSTFSVSTKADRMGYRLQGPVITHRQAAPKSIISEPSMPGSVQIPADGQPIVLLVEQTVGGYSKIATVISTDLARIAQAIPGDPVRFERLSLEMAHRLCREEEGLLEKIRNRLSAA